MSKQRLDVLLVDRGLAESRALAQRLIMAGQVRVNGQIALKPSQTLEADTPISVDHGPPYVSRGGEKLAAALNEFSILIDEKICADVGASTGGFTDCLLQNGAKRVYAIDVGQGILHWKLRQDERVVVMERANARHIEKLPEPIEITTVDASFISLKVLLPVIKSWLAPSGQVIALIKPQFEAGRREAAKGDGVIRDPAIHGRIVQDIADFSQEIGFLVRGAMRSPLLGPKGNTEFLLWLEHEH